MSKASTNRRMYVLSRSAQFVRVISILALLLVCGQSSASTGDCKDLAQQNAEILETHQVDTAVLSFTLDPTGVTDLYIEPDEERDEGYLQLVQDPNDLSSWTIVLTSSVDLNLMNPSPPLVPDTEEDLSCEYPGSNLTAPAAKNMLDYSLHCNSSNYGILSHNVRVGIANVNQYHPQFFCPPFYKSVNELTPISTTVYKMAGLAYDPDYAGEIHLYNLTGTAEEHFEQSGLASEGFIRLSKPLDYDHGTRLYELNVTAVDRGQPKLSNWTSLFIEVTDGDDQSPVFDQEEYNISFQEEKGDIVGQEFSTTPPVYAYDLDKGINATVQYELIRGHIVQNVTYFDLNETTGRLIPLQTFDREDIASFQLRIQAYQTDNPLKRTARSIVNVPVEDINDHAPQMLQERYEITIPENLPDGLFVLQVAAFDMDEGNNSVFSFKIEDDENAFKVYPTTGVITVADYTKLDRERVESLHFYVYAKETWTSEQWKSNYSDVIVTLSDVNDNNPEFHVDTYSLTLDWPYNDTESLGWLYANDSDSGANGLVRYASLQVSNCPPEWFRLDDVTGQLWALSVSANTETSCFLNVLVEDQAVEETQRRLGTTAVEVSVSPAPTTIQRLTTIVHDDDATSMPREYTTFRDVSSKTSRSPGVGTGPGSVTVPNGDASVPGGDTMTPTAKVSQPNVSPSGEASDVTRPASDVSHPPGVSQPDNVVSDPASGFSTPDRGVSHTVSFPDNDVSHPDGGSFPPIWNMSQPDGGVTPDSTPDGTPDGNTLSPSVGQTGNGVTQPDSKVSHSDSDVSEPASGVTKPDGDVSQSDSGVSQPENGVTQPGNDVSQSKSDVSKPENGVTQPGGDVSQSDGDVSHPGGGIRPTEPGGDPSQPGAGVTQPGDTATHTTGGVTQPDGDVSQSGGDVSQPGGSGTQPASDVSHSDAYASGPGVTKPDSDSTQPSRDASQPGGSVTRPGGDASQTSNRVSQTTNTVTRTSSDVSRPGDVSHPSHTVSEPDGVSKPGNVTLPDDNVSTSEHTRSSVTYSVTTSQTWSSSSPGSSVSRGDVDYTTVGTSKATDCPPRGGTVYPNEYYVFLALMLLFLLLVIVLTVALLYTLRKLKKEREDSFSPRDVDDTGTYMAIEDGAYNKTIFI